MFEDILGKDDTFITIECQGGCGRTTDYDITHLKKIDSAIQWQIVWVCPDCHDKKLQDVGVDDV